MAKTSKTKGVAPKKKLEKQARRIITDRFTNMVSFKEGVIDGTDIECVHDMRVASRRLRAAMRNFADCFPQKKFRKYLKSAENITSTLGTVRDLDVLIDRFQKDIEAMSEDEQVGVQHLIERLQEKRQEARIPMLKLFKELDMEDFDRKFLKFFEV